MESMFTTTGQVKPFVSRLRELALEALAERARSIT